MTFRRPELLSPAGDWDCLRAAVANGANAVYFGLPKFNARIRAQNFQLGELEKVMAFLHHYDVRGFVTFNTLVFTDELGEAVELLKALGFAGVDAIIVQDLGLVRLARQVVPELEVHASTQMTITSPEGLALVKGLGISRAVLARELSLRELKAFQSVDVPVEVFVHGALCVAYSGQCLTSEALGQRSANRGACAQACRLPYQLIVDQVVKDLGDKKYLLSPQDLAGLEQIPDLIKLGVASFKIEGRLKAPEYVAAVTRIYRAAIDKALDSDAESPFTAKPDDTYRLEMTFSRGLYSGWLNGVNHQKLVNGRFGKKRGAFIGSIHQIGTDWVELVPEILVKPGDGVVFDTGEDTDNEQGGRVYEVQGHKLKFQNGQIDFRKLKVGHRVWKTDDPVLNRELRASFQEAPAHRKQPVDLVVLGNVGSPLKLIMKTDVSVEVSSSQLLTPAKTVPLTSASLREHLGRLGGTRFVLRNFRAELAGEPFLPISAVNDLRRQAVQKLEDMRSPSGVKSVSHTKIEALLHRWQNSPSVQSELIVLCRTFEQIEAALETGVPTIYADFEDIRRYREVISRIGTVARTFLATPRIQKPGEQGFLRLIANCKPDGVLIRNLGAISFFQQSGVRMRGDFSLNVTNPITAQLLVEQGLEQLTISYDLNLEQILALLRYRPADRFELTIHQHMPMFHMEHCVFAAFLSDGTDYTNCGRPCDSHSVQLRDRIGLEHLVKADVGCRNTVFNARVQTGSRHTEILLGAGLRIFRIEFLNEDRSSAAKLIRLYRKLLNGDISGDDVWRELKAHDQLGVTRGTLE